MKIFSSLTRNQKEALGLLQIGTFLEYFDLMLYVHMAVVLDDIFFSKDNYTSSFIAYFSFCSTFVFRPIGAYLFGWLGDNIGRKTTVIITTMLMSIACIIMAVLPTYAQIGITASWLVTLCRVLQGMSSMGEIIGAEVYMTEITKPPAQYPITSFISVASAFGAMAALAVASLITGLGMNWRIAFWIGAGIAIMGSMARIMLRETPEFIDAKRKSERILDRKINDEAEKRKKIKEVEKIIENQNIDKKTRWAYFFIYCGWPVTFYLSYIYFNPALKSFGYSSEDIIFHNFILSIVSAIASTVWAVMSYKTHPLTILKKRGIVSLLFFCCLPFLVTFCNHPIQLRILQSFLLIFSLTAIPASSIFIKNFPVLKRFTTSSMVYASSRAFMYMVTSLGIIWVEKIFGHYGLWIIAIPTNLLYLYGVKHFEFVEKNYSETRIKEDIQSLLKIKHTIGVI